MSVNRRQFIKAGSLALGSLAVHSLPLQARPAETKATVYFTPEITTESLLRIYEKVCAPLQGRIAIKLHTGEPHGPNILPRDMVRALQARIPNSTIVECNVLYPSPRQTTEGHRETLRTNGWTFCPVDIMDADGEVSLPIPGGRHLKEVAVGKNLLNYDSMLVLTHFKGHVMGGFGGSLKNIAIGCASGKTGKAQLHSDGTNLWAGRCSWSAWWRAARPSPPTSRGIWRTSTSCAACPWTVTARGPVPPSPPPRISASWLPPICWP